MGEVVESKSSNMITHDFQHENFKFLKYIFKIRILSFHCNHCENITDFTLYESDYMNRQNQILYNKKICYNIPHLRSKFRSEKYIFYKVNFLIYIIKNIKKYVSRLKFKIFKVKYQYVPTQTLRKKWDYI